MARPISHLLEREPQPANPAAGWPSSTGSFVLPHGFCSLWGCSSVQPCGAATVCVPLGTLCALAQSWMDGSTTAAPFLLPQPAAATQVPHQQQPSSSILFPCFFLVLFWFGFFPKWNPFCAQAFLQAGSQGWHGAGSTQTLLRLILPSPPGNGVPVTLLVPHKVGGLPGAAKGLHPSGMVLWWQLLRGTRAESLQCSC